MSKILDISGRKFNSITVINIKEVKSKRVYWYCMCACGTMFFALGSSIKSGHTKSCGCHNKKVRSDAWKTHGCSMQVNSSKEHKSTYTSWQGIKSRCNNPKSTGFYLYGAKGIKMCERWINSFDAFLEDMGVKPTMQHSIDRFPDKNGNYEPSNCRWATPLQQMHNVNYNSWYEFNNERKILTEWARVLKTQNSSIIFHLNKGRDFGWIANHFIVKNNINV